MNGKSISEKRFRKFSVEKFRKILKAWTITTGPLTSPVPPTGHSIDISCSQLNCTQKSSDIKTNEKVRETDKTDKTIELNDSLSSIPETPDFVDKRKVLKSDNKKRKPNKR